MISEDLVSRHSVLTVKRHRNAVPMFGLRVFRLCQQSASPCVCLVGMEGGREWLSHNWGVWEVNTDSQEVGPGGQILNQHHESPRIGLTFGQEGEVFCSDCLDFSSFWNSLWGPFQTHSLDYLLCHLPVHSLPVCPMTSWVMNASCFQASRVSRSKTTGLLSRWHHYLIPS
jgi:hypothetical protein